MHALHVRFSVHFCTFPSRSRPINDLKWPVFIVLRGRSLDNKLFFPVSTCKPLIPIKFQETFKYFTSQATWNIRGIISKTQSYIIKFADDVVAVVEVALTHVSAAMFQWRPYVNISPIPEQLNWNAWTNCSYFTTAMYI